MHTGGITMRQLSDECGYSYTYLSRVLHGFRDTDKTRQTIMEALERLEARTRGEANGAG